VVKWFLPDASLLALQGNRESSGKNHSTKVTYCYG